jgi:hypothetical protein
MPKLSRRSALGAMAALAGGVGVASATSAEAAAAGTNGADQETVAITIDATNVRCTGDRRTVGGHFLLSGDALRDGAADGEFFAQGTVANQRDVVSASTASVQTQTFVLSDGTLIGSGAVGNDGTGAFAVTGGTGRYDGARGSYTAVQDTDTAHGGSATYTFTINIGKASG